MTFVKRQPKSTYVDIFASQWRIKVPKDHPDAEPHELKKGPNEGTTIYHALYAQMESLQLIGVGFDPKEKYGPQWGFKFVDAEDRHIIVQLSGTDFSTDGFLRTLRNVRLDKPMDLGAYGYTATNEGGEERTRTVITIKQKDNPNLAIDKNGVKKDYVSWAYPMDSDEIPEIQWTEINGMNVGNWEKRNEFWAEMISEHILPNITDTVVEKKEAEVEEAEVVEKKEVKDPPPIGAEPDWLK